jgi:LasA protease
LPPTATPLPQPTRPVYSGTPTPDPPHTAVGTTPTLPHTVAAGETLAYIALQYNSSVDELVRANGLASADTLYVGQQLTIPTASALISPSFKVIPDSEVVYGPSARGFNVRQFVGRYNGHLLRMEDVIEGRRLAGPEVVELVALRYSVHPRLLLAMLEYRTGWVSQTEPTVQSAVFMGKGQAGYSGLYLQLGWAADQINRGYYGRGEGGITSLQVADGTRVAFHPEINHGTAAVQNWLASHDNARYDRWLQEVGATGFYATYNRLFGNPFAYTVDPLWPENLVQPPLILPFEVGEPWYFTGGPHGGWASGSSWASLDFAPDAELRGCYLSQTWVTAAAGGQVIFSDMGGVLLDLDGDGFVGTGWVLVYWHVDQSGRIPTGSVVETGDRLGHASCEGGYSNGTHIHFARRYNGQWVSADGSLPFNLDGWVSSGLGREYDGLLTRDGVSKEACVCTGEINELIRE